MVPADVAEKWGARGVHSIAPCRRFRGFTPILGLEPHLSLWSDAIRGKAELKLFGMCRSDGCSLDRLNCYLSRGASGILAALNQVRFSGILRENTYQVHFYKKVCTGVKPW